MVAMGTTDNKSFLYRLTETGTNEDGKPDLNFEYIDGRGLNTSNRFINTRFGAGIHITSNRNIVSYVTDRKPNSKIRINEFRYDRNEDDVELVPDFTAAYRDILSPVPTNPNMIQLPRGREFTLSATISNIANNLSSLPPYYEVYLLSEEDYNDFNQNPNNFFSDENNQNRQDKIIADGWANPPSVLFGNTDNPNSYTVKLDRKPTANVIIDIDGTTTTDNTSLVFTPENWDQAQTVNIANLSGVINHTISNNSAVEYQNLALSNITFQTDNQGNTQLIINNPSLNYLFTEENINIDVFIPLKFEEDNDYRLLLVVEPNNNQQETNVKNNYIFSDTIEIIPPTDENGNLIAITDLYQEMIEEIDGELTDLVIKNSQITNISSDRQEFTIQWDIHNQSQVNLVDDISVEQPSLITSIYLLNSPDSDIANELIDSYLSEKEYPSQLTLVEQIKFFENIEAGQTISLEKTISLNTPVNDQQSIILATFPETNLDAQLEQNISLVDLPSEDQITFDIDGDGQYLAAVDGLLFYGYLNIRNLPSSLRDNLTQQLADNLINPNSNATRTTVVAIASYLEDNPELMDIDGDQQISAAIDGLLAYGYFNIRDLPPSLRDNLTQQLADNLIPDNSNAIRNTGADIASFIEGYIIA